MWIYRTYIGNEPRKIERKTAPRAGAGNWGRGETSPPRPTVKTALGRIA